MTLPDCQQLLALSIDEWAALRKRFHAVGLSAAAVAELLAPGAGMAQAMARPTLLWRARQAKSPVADTLRMFAFEDPIPRADAQTALGDISLDRLLDVGLLRTNAAGAVSSPFSLSVGVDTFFLCDFLHHGTDAAMGPGGTTLLLCVSSTPAKRVGTLLDLGCGAGTAAITLAALADKVVGTDISERAIAIARLNAALNGVTNVEFRVGDMFAPVAGETFDLIVSQPPFIPRVEASTDGEYMLGGARGDELARRLLATVAPHVAPGGRVFTVIDWPIVDDEPLETRVRNEVASPEFDVLVMQGPEAQLDDWVSQTLSLKDPSLGPEYQEKALALRAHVDRMGIRSFRMAVSVIARAITQPGWTSTVHVGDWSVIEGTPRVVERHFAARRLLEGGPEALLAARLRIPEGVTFTPVPPDRTRIQFAPHLLVPSAVVSADSARACQTMHTSADVREGLKRLQKKEKKNITEVILTLMKSSLLHGLLVVDG